MVGEIISLQICVGHREPMNPVDSATFIEGFGIEGDRHAIKSGARTVRQVLLMDEDTLEGFGLGIGQVRENVTVRGIDLHEVPAGQRLALGDDVVVDQPVLALSDIPEGGFFKRIWDAIKLFFVQLFE